MLRAETDRLTELVRGFTGRRVVVVGDALADQFLSGEISRVSREAPVLILRHERTETAPGGAANCASNLASLGARAGLIGVVGEDEAGHTLASKLRATGVDCGGLLISASQRTTTKVRVLAGHPHSLRQQVIRVDYEGPPLSGEAVVNELSARLRAAVAQAEAVIISDYNYGVADPAVVETLREASRERALPVLADSRFRLLDFGGFTAATPNEDEVENILGRRLDDALALEAAAGELLARLGHRALLVTRGKHGMLLAEVGRAPLHLPAVGEREAVDVTGAGDTVIATFALALAAGASFSEAAQLANHAGGIVVMKRGTACVSPSELIASLEAANAP